MQTIPDTQKTEKSTQIFKDYSKKVKDKLLNEFDYVVEDMLINEDNVNEFIAFLNFCFQAKNDFFVENFNKRIIKNVYLAYNQIKTNILSPEIDYIFESISHDQIKLLRFIVLNFINNFDKITKNNPEICIYVSKESLKNFLTYFSTKLNS
jgi:hypothetical protein